MAMPMRRHRVRLRDASTRLMTSRPFRGLLAKVAAAQPDAITLK